MILREGKAFRALNIEGLCLHAHQYHYAQNTIVSNWSGAAFELNNKTLTLSYLNSLQVLRPQTHSWPLVLLCPGWQLSLEKKRNKTEWKRLAIYWES